MNLEDIGKILNNPSFDGTAALRNHRENLLEKRQQLDQLIATVEKTMAAAEGRKKMSDKEKFEGFKHELIEENERKYGQEIREKYSDEVVNKSNKKIKNMSQQDYEEITKLGDEVMETLHAAMQTGDSAGQLAQKAVDLHRQWLSFYWDAYTKEAHAGVAQMYVDDDRFRAYYDEKQPGTAEFLRDAVFIYTGRE